MQHSFGILKPDCVRRGLIDVAFELVCNSELEIIFSKRVHLCKEDAEFLYSRCCKESFFDGLISFMTSGDVVLYVVKSKNGRCAIDTLNSVTGSTDPKKAKQNTLRSLGSSVRENIAHSTMNTETFWSEITRFLNPEEVSDLKLDS